MYFPNVYWSPHPTTHTHTHTHTHTQTQTYTPVGPSRTLQLHTLHGAPTSLGNGREIVNAVVIHFSNLHEVGIFIFTYIRTYLISIKHNLFLHGNVPNRFKSHQFRGRIWLEEKQSMNENVTQSQRIFSEVSIETRPSVCMRGIPQW